MHLLNEYLINYMFVIARAAYVSRVSKFNVIIGSVFTVNQLKGEECVSDEKMD